MAASQGAKDVKPEWFNPYQDTIREQAAKEAIAPEAARTFLQLAKESKLPGWVVNCADIEFIRLAAR